MVEGQRLAKRGGRRMAAVSVGMSAAVSPARAPAVNAGVGGGIST